MIFTKRLTFPSSAIAGVALVLGCNDGRPPVDTSTTRATVSGVAGAISKTVSDGEIAFNPSNAERKVSSGISKIGKDGEYSLTSMEGGNMVSFKGSFMKGHEGPRPMTRYATLTPGENLYDFDLFSESDVVRGPTPPRGKSTEKR